MSGIPEITCEYSPTYKKIIVADVLGGIRPIGVSMTVYSEDSDFTAALETHPISPGRVKIKRIVECELVINPMELKSIYAWLGDKIKEYEDTFGPIRSPEEITSRQKRKDKDA